MNKILASTDFSENARAAVLYAARLSLALGAQLDIVHTYNLPIATGIYGEANDFLQRRIRSDMADLSRWLDQQTGVDLKMHPRILTGSPTQAIVEMADEYDVVVMGTIGQTGIERWLMGSTTIGVIERTATPVLAIPPSQKYAPITGVVLALDDEGIDKESLVRGLLALARGFDAHIYVFHHDEGVWDKGLEGDLSMYLKGMEYSLHYDMGTSTTWEAIQSFARDEGAQLIAMIRRERTGLERWLGLKSATVQSVQQTNMPLLILQERTSEE